MQVQLARSSPSALGKLAIRSNCFCFEAAESRKLLIFIKYMSGTTCRLNGGELEQPMATFDVNTGTPVTSAVSTQVRENRSRNVKRRADETEPRVVVEKKGG